MSTITYWNGEPTECVRGTGVVVDNGTFPKAWYKEAGLVDKRVPVVKVQYGHQEFYLYNVDNEGWHKVTDGKGSPRLAHHNLDVEKFVADEL